MAKATPNTEGLPLDTPPPASPSTNGTGPHTEQANTPASGAGEQAKADANSNDGEQAKDEAKKLLYPEFLLDLKDNPEIWERFSFCAQYNSYLWRPYHPHNDTNGVLDKWELDKDAAQLTEAITHQMVEHKINRSPSSVLKEIKGYLHLPQPHETDLRWDERDDMIGAPGGQIIATRPITYRDSEGQSRVIRPCQNIRAHHNLLIHKQLGVTPQKGAHPAVDELLDHLCRTPEERTWLLRFMALCLTPKTSERVFLMIVGEPQAGKSTLCELLSDLLGDFAEVLDNDTFTPNFNLRFASKNWQSKRLLWMDDMTEARWGNVSISAELRRGGGTRQNSTVLSPATSYSLSTSSLTSSSSTP